MDKTLLVIENDETLVDLISFYFSENGYTIYSALDGNEGVELALEHKPSAIICDVIMGEMHGFDVLRTLRERPEMKDTVIIITSAKAYKPDIVRARELGATEYVVKPFRTDELLALVERHLATPRWPE
ncbi:MAG TPA: response regulator [Burkholderiales bacterium]|nr:response regulator [Burkholderiales bacterium]